MAVLVAAVLAASAQVRPETVEAIRVNQVGSVHVDEGFVRAHISVKPGESLSASAVSRDVRDLLSTGRFSDVRVEVKSDDGKIVLVYNVQSKLTLAGPLNVKGGKHFSTQKIRDLMELKPGDLFDDASLSVKVGKVLAEYRTDHYVSADVKWSSNVADKESGSAEVSLDVTEGNKSVVRSITVTGNKGVPSVVLEAAAGKPAWWDPTEWFSSKTLDRDEFEMMRESIRAACVERGYLDAEVGLPEVTDMGGGRNDLKFPVKEGLFYRLGSVTVTGVKLFPESELTRLVGLRRGTPALVADVSRTADNLRQYYTSRGYLMTSVRQSFTARPAVNPGEGVLDVVFAITEGTLVHVRNVFVRGNSVTREKVIRRELSVYPGDVFNERQVTRSENRLRNLGYFSRVSTHPESTAKPEEDDLIFDVEEQRTGSFMLGGGFSSIESFIGYFEISEGNFDIANWPPKGGGEKLRLRGQFGTRTTLGEISLVEPWFLDRRLSLGLDLSANKTDYDDYSLKSAGGSVTIGRPLNFIFDRIWVKYGLEQLEIASVTDTNAYARISGDRAGEPYYFAYTNQLKSSLEVIMEREARDNVFFPERGNRLYVRGYLSGGMLGGDSEVYGWEVKAEQYFGLWYKHVLGFRARVEVTDEYGASGEMSIYDRLFAGGGRTIRGFGYRDVGPKVMRTDAATGNTEYRPIGGRTLALGTVEYVIPLVEKLKIALFCDSGNVAEDAYDFDFGSMASSAGVEFRLDVPQFPIRVNYSFILQKDNENTKERPWGFWIGSGF